MFSTTLYNQSRNLLDKIMSVVALASLCAVCELAGGIKLDPGTNGRPFNAFMHQQKAF